MTNLKGNIFFIVRRKWARCVFFWDMTTGSRSGKVVREIQSYGIFGSFSPKVCQCASMWLSVAVAIALLSALYVSLAPVFIHIYSTVGQRKINTKHNSDVTRRALSDWPLVALITSHYLWVRVRTSCKPRYIYWPENSCGGVIFRGVHEQESRWFLWSCRVWLVPMWKCDAFSCSYVSSSVLESWRIFRTQNAMLMKGFPECASVGRCQNGLNYRSLGTETLSTLVLLIRARNEVWAAAATVHLTLYSKTIYHIYKTNNKTNIY